VPLRGSEHPYPDLSPSRGKVSDAVIDCVSSFRGERAFMNHFVVKVSSPLWLRY